jgi:thioredoxin reductase (NADPH)
MAEQREMYDFLIIGAGCAGASGAMYASRLNLKSVMIGELPGGLITTTHLVENWPGIKSITGPDLASALLDHATSFGVPLINARVTEVTKAVAAPGEGKQSGYIVKTSTETYYAKTVLFATGTEHKKLGAPGEKELENKGVSYCALCDGAFFKGKTVCVIGGGDSAAKEALLLSEYCPKVYIFVRKNVLRAEPVNGERVKAKSDKIEVRFNTEVAEIIGKERVEKVRLKSGEEIDMQGVFMAIGHNALSGLAGRLGVQLNDKKEIVINRRAETNLPGVYGAGDVCDTEFKQAITGSAEAVTASYFAFDYLGKNTVVFE